MNRKLKIADLSIKKDDKILLLEKPFSYKKLKLSHIQKPGPIIKPEGLWYGIGTAWIDWCKKEGFRYDFTKPLYIYRLTLDMSKILCLNTPEDLNWFTNKYNIKEYGGGYLNWDRIAKEYSGIEIPFYHWSKRFEWSWYYGWDVASGVIWDKNVIIKVEQIGV